MNFEFAERLKKLPPYLFVEIDRSKKKAKASGKKILDFGIGDPDLPTPNPIIDALRKAALDPRNHRYALDAGLSEFRMAIAAWFEKRFGVRLNPEDEILPLIGSKEGIGHIPLAFINPGEGVLVPEPGYPVYQSATWFAGGIPLYMSLLEKNGFLPDLDALKLAGTPNVKMMFLNYPNNPTGAVADSSFFERVVSFARKHEIIVCHDAAYTEIYYDQKPSSFLAVDGAKEVGLEFHSLSKTFNMTGWRIGFAVGNAKLIQGLAKVKSNLDSGIFQAIQWAGVAALTSAEKDREPLLKTYRSRRDAMIEGLQAAGWKVKAPEASFYIWARVPKGLDSKQMALRLLGDLGIVVTPGVGFGPSGEGYIRFSLTVPEEQIREAVSLLKGWVVKH